MIHPQTLYEVGKLRINRGEKYEIHAMGSRNIMEEIVLDKYNNQS
jgi:hypothetical protein